jgi:hypothetical protein
VIVRSALVCLGQRRRTLISEGGIALTDSPSTTDGVNLLWSGGSDSTFQLLRLLLVHRCRVTPFYLIDADRRSTGVELWTMKRIKERLFTERPHTQELLQPTRFFSVEDIAPDAEITAALRAIQCKHQIGDQFEWFARLCKQHSIDSMELTVERVVGSPSWDLRGMVAERQDGSRTVYCVDERFSSTAEYVLFHYFTLPVYGLTKKDMKLIVDENGWNEIMAMTWFCHDPRRGMKPCGKCHPCTSAIKEGFAWRIPLSSRALGSFDRSVTVPAKGVAKSTLDRLGLLAYVQEQRRSRRERERLR